MSSKEYDQIRVICSECEKILTDIDPRFVKEPSNIRPFRFVHCCGLGVSIFIIDALKTDKETKREHQRNRYHVIKLGDRTVSSLKFKGLERLFDARFQVYKLPNSSVKNHESPKTHLAESKAPINPKSPQDIVKREEEKEKKTRKPHLATLFRFFVLFFILIFVIGTSGGPANLLYNRGEGEEVSLDDLGKVIKELRDQQDTILKTLRIILFFIVTLFIETLF
jgi:hypothetical protein